MSEESRIFPLSEQGVQKAAVLFRDEEGELKETMILSALQGLMGTLTGDDPDEPQTVRSIVGDLTFFAGDADNDAAKELIRTANTPLLAAISGTAEQQERWAEQLDAVLPDSRRTTRYAIKKEPDVFDREQLRGYLDLLPEGYRIVQIDAQWYPVCMKEEWSCDFVSNFPDADAYEKNGLGFLILNEAGQPVAGASSYSYYNGGIEIEIDTHIDYRRRKLAQIAGARLILACLERGLYPSWDAANLGSVALSEKLGYHFDHPYTAWFQPQIVRTAKEKSQHG